MNSSELAANTNEQSSVQTVRPFIMLNHLVSGGSSHNLQNDGDGNHILKDKTSSLFIKMVLASHSNPEGQFELSGAPPLDLQELVTEFSLNRECVNQLAAEAGFRVITAGLTPITGIESIDWMPKGRYVIMREYLPERGDLAHYMMKGTTSVQCNYDFIDEADCALKVALVLAVCTSYHRNVCKLSI